MLNIREFLEEDILWRNPEKFSCKSNVSTFGNIAWILRPKKPILRELKYSPIQTNEEMLPKKGGVWGFRVAACVEEALGGLSPRPVFRSAIERKIQPMRSVRAGGHFKRLAAKRIHMRNLWGEILWENIYFFYLALSFNYF